jgi:hypothetical protein
MGKLKSQLAAQLVVSYKGLEYRITKHFDEMPVNTRC